MTAEEEVAAVNSAGRSGIGFGRKNVLQLTYLRTWACPMLHILHGIWRHRPWGLWKVLGCHLDCGREDVGRTKRKHSRARP